MYIYIYIYINIHVYIYIYMYLCLHTDRYTHAYVQLPPREGRALLTKRAVVHHGLLDLGHLIIFREFRRRR